MRRNYMSPEFDYNKVYGTYNMIEESSFFGSKMIEIEDLIIIDEKNLIYYQNLNGEQIDISIENSLSPVVFSSSDSKYINSNLTIDQNQSDFDRNNKSKFVLEVDIISIFKEYLFGLLKQYRTFEGVSNQLTSSGDVNSAIREYIFNNIISKYQFQKIEVFIKYNDIINQNILRFKNNWNSNIGVSEYRHNKIETKTEFDYSKISVFFNQEKISSEYSFDYYYKLYFEKI